MCTRSTPRPGVKFGSERRTNRCPPRGRLPTARFTSAVTNGKFYAFNAQTGAVKWKFATDGERRFEAKGLHGMQPKNQTIADAFDLFLSSSVIASGVVYFGSGDGTFMRSIRPPASCVGNSKPAMFCTPRPHSQMAFCFSEVGIVIFMPWTLRQEKRNGVSMEAKTR
jgi:hypothetical protein